MRWHIAEIITRAIMNMLFRYKFAFYDHGNPAPPLIFYAARYSMQLRKACWRRWRWSLLNTGLPLPDTSVEINEDGTLKIKTHKDRIAEGYKLHRLYKGED